MSTGPAENVQARAGGDAPDREMFVADRGASGPASGAGTLRVAPPRTANSAPVPVQQDKGSVPEALMRLSAAGTKNLRAELSLASAELRDKAGELSQAQLALRARDQEVSLLRAALAERDMRLRDSKSELLGACVELHAKESELRGAYDRLAVGARERADVRAALVASQTELAAARAELEAWAQARLEAGLAQARGGDGVAEAHLGAGAAQAHGGDGVAEARLEAGLAQARGTSSVAQGEENEPGLQSGAAPRGWRGAAPRPASGAGVSQGLETLNLLRDLAALSAQVLADAREDADVFQQGRGGNAQQRQP